MAISMLQASSLLLFLSSLSIASPMATGSSLLNSSYVNPVFKQSRANFNKYSLTTIKALASNTNLNHDTSFRAQDAWAEVVQWDKLHGTRMFYKPFTEAEDYDTMHQSGCFQYWGVPLCDCFNDDSNTGARTSLQGYAAYGDNVFLQRAINVQDFVSTHGFISHQVISEGYLKGSHYPNNTLESTCNGESMYGGVYWQNGVPNQANNKAAADPSVDTGATLGYALSSTQLCRITGNMTYCDRATDAMTFADRHFIDPSNGFATGHIDGNNCTKPTSYVNLFGTGSYIAAYAILGNTTKNTEMLGKARDVAIKAMRTDLWNTKQGVLAKGIASSVPDHAGVAGTPGSFLKSLHEAYPFMEADLQMAIRQYTMIQYWSMVNNASDNPKQPSMFSRDWQGPYTAPSTPEEAQQGEVPASGVLNAIADIIPASAFPNHDAADVPVITL